MPLIPPPPIPETVPLPAMSPQAAGAGWGAIESAAGQTERLALYTGNVAAKIQAAQDQTLAQKAENQIEDDIFGAVESYRDRSDYYEFPPDAEKTAQELRKKYEAQYGKNPRVWNAIEGFLDGKIRSFQRTVEIKRLDLLTQDAKAQLLIKRDNAQREITQAVTPEEKEIKRNEYFGALLAAKSVGTISPIEEVQLRDTFDLDTERAEVAGGTRSTDMRTVIRTIDRIDRHEFKALEARDPDYLTSMKATAERWLDTLTARTEKQILEQTVNGAVTNLMDDFRQPDGSVDFEEARKRLSSPDFQRQRGLRDEKGVANADAINEVLLRVKAFEGQENNTKTAAREKYDKDVWQLYRKGDYAGVFKMIDDPNSPLTVPQSRAWEDAIQSAQKAGKDASGDAPYIVTANEMIRQGRPRKEIQTFVLTSPMSAANKEQYINKMEAQSNNEIEDGRRLGYGDIQEMIFPRSRGMVISPETMFASPKEARNMMNAQMALDAWIARELAAGKDLNRTAIRTKAQQLVYTVQNLADKVDAIDAKTQADLEALQKAMQQAGNKK